MKKSLIALAVLGFSGMAMAQSSVTLYGVADAGYARTQAYNFGVDAKGNPINVSGGGTTGALAGFANRNGVGSKVSTNGFSGSGMMNNGTSRLGVRGVEDLGGGLKAGFNFEDGLSLADGASNLSGGNFWSREANVWLGGNWGTFKMGRDLNPSFFAVAAWELTQTANYSVVGDTYNYTGEGPRTSSMFQYKTPSFSGLTASIAVVPKDNGPVDLNGKHHAQWDGNVVYGNGPISAGLGINKIQSQKTNWTLGGKYTFGLASGQLALAASYNSINTGSELPGYAGLPSGSFGNIARRGFSLGGSYMTGPFTLTLDVTRDTTSRIDVTGLGSQDLKKYTNAVVEGKYALSKRTFVYAAYLRLDSTNNYGIGLRHNF